MSNYPKALDTDLNLYHVHDSLKLPLARDYNPGDSTIYVDGDTKDFPDNGIITLIDQTSEANERSTSLNYYGKTTDSFLNCDIAQDSVAYFKSKKFTTVAMQLRAEHHNSLVDAVIAIQTFLGTHKTLDKAPNGDTLIGRINFLQSIIFSPKAWFEVDNITGITPLTCHFVSKSAGIGKNIGNVQYIWNFGDGNELVTLDDKIEHTYTRPGIYDVELRIKTSFGDDAIKFESLIKARIDSPEEALIQFNLQENQLLREGKLRMPTNQLVEVRVKDGQERENISNAGEHLNKNKEPIDPIINYSWNLSDELPHGNSDKTRAAYQLGGLRDLVLRVDTEFGAYRITTYEKCLDIVELTNMWLWTKNESGVQSHEFGLLSETFKTCPTTNLNVVANDGFLNDQRQISEFNRNCGVAPKSRVCSGLQGTAVLYWASGRDKDSLKADEKINFCEYNAFTDVYTSLNSAHRAWNWASLASQDDIYFILGQSDFFLSGMSPVNQSKLTFDLKSGTLSNEEIHGYSFINGAQEVQWHPALFNQEGKSIHGDFAVYRTTWKDQVGYMARNSSVGDDFRIGHFYKTSGIFSSPFVNLVKLLDIPGNKSEGQLAPMENGIYFFNNSDSAALYEESSGVWKNIASGNPGLFKTLQDRKIPGHENESNTLLAASNRSKKAYLSFDYSSNAFIKFNENDMTFKNVGVRPAGEQWQLAIW